MSLETTPIRVLAARVAARDIGAAEVTAYFLDRIARLDGPLAGMNVVAPEMALAAARALDARREGAVGPLAGVPLSVKDIADVAGLPSAGASASRAGRIAAGDAPVVARMKAAGGIVLGKANCHELAFGGPSFDLPFPPARNPWDTGRFPGGSSSGSGVTVAAGLCLGSLATDTAGSIRLPATMCGVFGLKPTRGLLPLAGISALAETMDHAGPIARSADDTRILFDAMAGRPPAPRGSGSLKGVRIGIPRDGWGEGAQIHPEVRGALDAALALVEAEGGEVHVLDLPPLDHFHAPGTVVMMAEVARAHAGAVRADWNRFGAIFRARALLGEAIAPEDYARAQRIRPLLTRRLAEGIAAVDALLIPGAMAPPGPLADVHPFYFMKEPIPNIVANYTGLPALAFPAGHTAEGLPLGVQILGAAGADHRLLDIAEAFELTDPARFAARDPGLS
ncbi:amidase [Paenirhodobacter sp.]|uniref:amidase n=1 Tax=Paenirhodobacter sp. TaxID=1965326 RepID=UPI003B3C15CC